VVSEAPVSGWAALVGRRVTVEVPASSANLGAGYDCLGLALDLVNRVTVEGVEVDRDGDPVTLEVTGEGAGELPASRDNRFVAGLEVALEAVLGPRPATAGWRITMANAIPLSRGLGSSAAASVGGVVAGASLAGLVAPGTELPVEDRLALATEVEGHPDNAAAVLLGGFVASARVGGRVHAVRFDVPDALRVVLLIPELHLATTEMRRALPSQVPLADAVENLGRVAIGVAGIAAGRLELLRELTVDRIHELYRAAVYPELPRLTAAAREAGAIGACLSGAGSTISAFVDTDTSAAAVMEALAATAAALNLPARALLVRPRNHGAQAIEAA
jgi:homoserine kinase